MTHTKSHAHENTIPEDRARKDELHKSSIALGPLRHALQRH